MNVFRVCSPHAFVSEKNEKRKHFEINSADRTGPDRTGPDRTGPDYLHPERETNRSSVPCLLVARFASSPKEDAKKSVHLRSPGRSGGSGPARSGSGIVHSIDRIRPRVRV